MVRDNAAATARLIAHAEAAGARTVIYFSSLSVYGEITGPAVDESTPVHNPDVYGMTKCLGEAMLRESASLRSFSIRLPGVLGPGSVRNWLTSVLAAARAGRRISIYNPDAPFNNACHINDLTDFIGELLEAGWSGHEAVTVGAAGMTTVRRAVQIIVNTLGSTSTIETRGGPPGFTISSDKACAFGYRPMQIEALITRFADENRT
jgi:nucleoside-diphosphate-sugar epimerase